MRDKFFLEKYPIKQIAKGEANFPQELAKVADSPQNLYYRGKIDCLNKSRTMAIVGTRLASDYGKEIAFNFAKQLANQGIIIVSGLALGIDTFAHQGALAAEQPTVAVLGTGLAQGSIYPQENLELAQKILNGGGCLISEYTAEIHGDKFTFPKRNRIISALSLGVLVVEAKYRSGALITANYAKKQNKKLFATPGNINLLNSKGPHLLIRQGAILVEKPSEIIKELGLEKLDFSPNLAGSQTKNKEQIIRQTLSQGALSIDQIIEKTNLPAPEVLAGVSLMEIEGTIKNIDNKYIINY